jgi:nicotinamide mononucleotide transporter
MSDKAINQLQKKAWWKHIIFFHDWSIFEKSLLGINVVVSIVFYILALVEPGKFSAYTYDKIQIKAFKNDTACIIFDTLSLITSFLNTCCLLLISKGRISNFIWGLIAVSFLGFLSYICSNTGTWIINWVIQIPMNILGMVMWKKHSQSKTPIKTRELNWIWKIIVVLIFVALTTIFYFIFNDDTVRRFWYEEPKLNKKLLYVLCDAAALAITIIAMILLTLRFVDQWYLWIFCNVIYIIMYIAQENAQLAITWAIGLTNACYGLYMWKFKKH